MSRNPIKKKAVGDIVLAMRKDLLGRSKLSYMDFRYTNIVKGSKNN
jgi:hypothetical protein